MIIPKKLNIGEKEYSIKKVRVVDWRNTSIVGQINYSDETMKLRVCNNDERISQDIFFHEVAHGILKEMEFNHPKISKFRNDEIFVQELGLTLRKTFLNLLKNQEARME